MSTELTTQTASAPPSSAVVRPGFNSTQGVQLLTDLAQIFSNSHLVPTLYRANKSNCMIAISMAARMGVDPLTVMQNLYIIQGKPSWSSQFLIANWNSCGRFSPIRYEWSEKRDACRAISTDLKTGEKLVGTLVTMTMAKGEGWIDKPGSKWKTMPEQMLQYRAAAFLIRAYAAEIALGLGTAEESEDVAGVRAAEPTATELSKVAATVKVIEPSADPVVDAVIEPAIEAKADPVVEAPAQPAAAVAAAATAAAKPEPPASPAVEEGIAVQPSASLQQVAPISQETFSFIGQMLSELKPDKDKFKAALQKHFGVESVKFLTEQQAQIVRADLEKKVANRRIEQWSKDQLPASGGAGEEPPFQS